jgi:hypothetical protein
LRDAGFGVVILNRPSSFGFFATWREIFIPGRILRKDAKIAKVKPKEIDA